MEPIIYWPSVFNKEDIKHAFILSSKRKPGHEQRLSLFPGFPGYSHDTFRTFLNTLVPRVFFSYTNFRHWSIGYQLRGGITHKHSDITRVVTAMDSWSHWHCLICFRLELCHADSLFQVLRYWGMTRKCNEHAKMWARDLEKGRTSRSIFVYVRAFSIRGPNYLEAWNRLSWWVLGFSFAAIIYQEIIIMNPALFFIRRGQEQTTTEV